MSLNGTPYKALSKSGSHARNNSLDQNKLMVTLSDTSDSSSDDIIPMQRRKKRGFSRKRSSQSHFFTRNNYPPNGLCALFKFLFVSVVITSLILSLSLLYNLYNRLDLLQLNINELQSTKGNLPVEIRSISSHLKVLDDNSTKIAENVSHVMNLTLSLQSRISEIEQKLIQITETTNASSAALSQVHEFGQFKEIVAGIVSKMAATETDMIKAREAVANNSRQISALDIRLTQLVNNSAAVDNNKQVVLNSTNSIQEIGDLLNELNQLNVTIGSITEQIETIRQAEKRLDEWRLAIQDKLSTLNITSDGDPKLHKSSVKKSDPATPLLKKLFASNSDVNM